MRRATRPLGYVLAASFVAIVASAATAFIVNRNPQYLPTGTVSTDVSVVDVVAPTPAATIEPTPHAFASHMALSNSDVAIETIRRLLNQGASVNIRDDRSRLPIDIAVRNGVDAEILEILFDHEDMVRFSPTILHDALIYRTATPEIMFLIFENAGTIEVSRSMDDEGRTPLDVALVVGANGDVMRSLLNADGIECLGWLCTTLCVTRA